MALENRMVLLFFKIAFYPAKTPKAIKAETTSDVDLDDLKHAPDLCKKY
jgi:hypothetical protein